jgi:hypothetical protein
MSLSAIRAKLMAQTEKTQQNQTIAQGDNAMYPFWNIDINQTASLRFLPDADSSNSFFWVEKAVIKLPFAGIKGQSDSKPVLIQVPCMEMYGESCPILNEVRTWYKDESLKETANKYWKKRTYLFQGFVRANPIADDKTPENPIRRFVITSQVFGIIKNSLMDPEIEELPTDYNRGLDFNIKKTKKGEYADYGTSGWARKESALTELERAAIEAHGLFNLKDFLPKKPSDAESRVIREMFEASTDGRAYDPDKWAAYYKPWGLKTDSNGAADEESSRSSIVVPVSMPASVAKSEPVINDADDEFDAPAPVVTPVAATPSSDKANDILALIRSRQGKTA